VAGVKSDDVGRVSLGRSTRTPRTELREHHSLAARRGARGADLASGRVGNAFVGECLKAPSDAWPGRALIKWVGRRGRISEKWLPTLCGVVVRDADRVLVVPLGESSAMVVVGVISGFARRPKSPRDRGPRLALQEDESLLVTTNSGDPIVEIRQEVTGPVVRLLKPDVDVELEGKLRISAARIDLRADKGDVAITASDNIALVGEQIRLN
jgi:hypothetical protein